MGGDCIIEINEDSESNNSSVSDSIDSDEQEEVSISDDDSISLDLSSQAKDTNQDSECPEDIPKFRLRNNLKAQIKK